MTKQSTEQPPAKRSRKELSEEKGSPPQESTAQSEPNVSALDIFSPKIFDKPNDLVKAYNNAKPYPHGVLDEVFVEGYAGKQVNR